MSEAKHQAYPADWDDEEAQARLPFWKRREFLLGLAILLVGLVVYLPRLGDYAFWDPWEPHYSQVAMEMNDGGSWLVPLYRKGDRWFSKPILPLWYFKISFLLFGQSEFTSRLPIVVLSMFALLMVYFFVGRLFHWKAGVIAALVLGTCPQFFFIGRQAIFDMPYVAMQTAALGFLLLALFKYPDRPRWIYAFWIFSAFAMMSKGLLAVVLPASVVGGYVLMTWDWAILKRMRFPSGLLVFFIVSAPWFIFMTAKFGLAYPKSFFIYHHFERMAGMIKKPNNTFDLYIQQIMYATFPWSAFLPVALLRFLTYTSEDLLGRTRKNLMVFLCFAMPYIFFTFSSTKFNHYIFPVVPFLAIMVAYYLHQVTSRPESPVLRFEILLSVLIFAILAKDLVTDYKYLIHLFIYYYDRRLPTGVNPRTAFYILFIPMGVVMGLPLIRRRFTSTILTAFGAVVVAFTLYCNAGLIPKLADTFSQKILWEAYEKDAKNNEPVCEYHSWQRRSVSYYFKNKSRYLNSRKADSHKRFFRTPGKLYCMVDRSILGKLRERVRKDNQRELFIVNSRHPFTYLVSTEAPENQKHKKTDYLFEKEPLIVNRMDVDFENGIRLLGWEIEEPEVKLGTQVKISLYFQAMKDIDEDYQVFIHGDMSGNGGRLNGDHTPVSGQYPTGRWEKGDIVKDTWTGAVSRNLATGRMSLHVGWFNSKGRVKVTKGRDDGEDRIRIGNIQVIE